MIRCATMKFPSFIIIIIAAGAISMQALPVVAGGISIDAGLTPPQDRWIFRTQLRYMHHEMPSGREMTVQMMPVVVAYGLRSDLSLLVRQLYVRKSMTVNGMDMATSGLGDLFVMAKYKAFRQNTAHYIFGVSPTLGLEIPIGTDQISGRKWNLHTGLYVSGRIGNWAADFNVVYIVTGIAREAGVIDDPGDETTVQLALARQIGLDNSAQLAFAPVLELAYNRVFSDRNDGQRLANTGESLFWLSPGAKFTWGSFIVEGLVQIPVYEDYDGIRMDRDPTILIGIRLML